MKLFRRAWRISVGTDGFDDFDCEFKVSRSLGGTPNTCELKLYNLSESTRSEIARRDLVRIEAGYTTGLTLLFVGDVRRAVSKLEGTDRVTTIEAGDGWRAIRSGRVLRSFGPNATVDAVVAALAEAAGVGVGNAREALRSAGLGRLSGTFPQGTVVDGSFADELTRVTASAGYEWSIQDGVLQLLRRGNALDRSAVLLSPDTGLLEATKTRARRLEAKTLLIPDLVPGRKVVVESPNVRGAFRLTKVDYAGATRGDEWTCSIEGSPLLT
jgi:hypothetical protein